MRVLHVTDCFLPRIGGIELHVRDLARRQQDAGDDVLVLTRTPQVQTRQVDDLVPVRHVRLVAPVARPPLKQILLDGRFDVVHVHTSLVSPLAAVSVHRAVAAGLPVVVTVHSHCPGPGAGLRRLERLSGARGLPVVWTAVSGAAAEPLRALLGSDRPVQVLPNAIDPAAWRRPVWRRDAGELVVVSVLRLAARKRPLAALRVMQAARGLVPDGVRLRLVIIGDGPLRHAVRRGAASMSGVEVTLCGRQDRSQIIAHFATADVFLSPATREAFGIAGLEARAAGLAVVAVSGTGVQEYVAHGREGLLADNDAGLARAVARLAADPSLLAGIQRHNLQVPPDLTWARALQRSQLAYDLARDLARASSHGEVPMRR